MNIEEAKSKVCPFIQTGDGISPSIQGVPIKNIRCIAGDCMAWHWHIEDRHPIKGLVFSTTDGYCRRIHEGEI